MSYSLLTYEQLLSEVESIKSTNLYAINRNAELVEDTAELVSGTDIEYLSQIFDGYRFFFNDVEDFLNDIQFELEQESITFGLVERINRFGVEANAQLLAFKPRVDKGVLNSVEGLKNALNEWYEQISNNLIALSELQQIAGALNSNFRHTTPFNEVKAEDIAIQCRDGITITKANEIYINESAVKLEGQRKKILLFLIEHYHTNPDFPVSWMDIEPEIREKEEPMEKDIVVDRVSSLRTRLAKLGFGSDVIEIRSIAKGVDASWKLIKH